MTSFNFPNFLPEMWTSLIQFFIILWICRHFWRSGIMTIQTVLLICVIRSEPTSSIPNACRVSLNSTWDQNDQAEQLNHDHVWSKSQKRLSPNFLSFSDVRIVGDNLTCFSKNFWHFYFHEILIWKFLTKFDDFC